MDAHIESFFAGLGSDFPAISFSYTNSPGKDYEESTLVAFSDFTRRTIGDRFT